MTSESQVAEARAFAESLRDIQGVQCSSADDWDDYGGFNILVYLNMERMRLPKGVSLRKVTNEIRRRMKGYNAYIKQVPIRQYERSYGQNYFTGYDYSYIMIDLRVPE